MLLRLRINEYAQLHEVLASRIAGAPSTANALLVADHTNVR
jgi:hypothetical protein